MEEQERRGYTLEDAERAETRARWARNLVAGTCVVGLLVAGVVVSWGLSVALFVSMLAGALALRAAQVLLELEDYTDACHELRAVQDRLQAMADNPPRDGSHLISPYHRGRIYDLEPQGAWPLSEDTDALPVEELDALWREEGDGRGQ